MLHFVNKIFFFYKFTDEQRVRSGTWEDQTCDKRVTPSLIHTRNLHHSHTISHRSAENSWCSESDPDLSSEEESDRSVASSTRYENKNNLKLLFDYTETLNEVNFK